MKAKFFVSLFLLICTAYFVCAVGQHEQESSMDGPVTIVYYMWDDPTYQSIVEAFNESQNEIFVDMQVVAAGDYQAKLTTVLAGGVEMDAYMQKSSSDMYPQYANGYILALDDLIKENGFDIDTISAYKDQISIDGKVVGIPFRGGAWFTYYNKVVLQNAGVANPNTFVENGDWTWDTYMEQARKIASGDGEVYGSLLYTWDTAQTIPAYQSGIMFIDDNGKIDINESLVRSFEIAKSLQDDMTIPSIAELKANKTHYSTAFYGGNVGLLLIGEWFPGQMLNGRDQNLLEGYTWDDWGLTRLPCDESTYITLGGPTVNHVHADSKHKEAAFKFLAWMGGPEGAEAIAKAGYMPPMTNLDSVKQIFNEVLPDSDSVSYYIEDAPRTAWLNIYASQGRNALKQVLEEYYAGQISSSELLEVIEAKFREAVELTN